MREIAILARLTVRETARRRLLLAFGVMTVVAIALSAWGFSRIPLTRTEGRPISALEVRGYTSQLLILTTFMFSFVLGLGTLSVAALSLAGDLESGVALAMLARPISRAQLLMGKWVGLGVLVIGYTVVAESLELWAVAQVTDYAPPHPGLTIAYLALEAVCLLTFSMLLSTRFAPMTAGVIGIAAFGGAWLAGVVGGIGQAIGNSAVGDLGTISRLLIPSDGIWRAAIHSMEPAALLAAASAQGKLARANPFFAGAAPPLVYLVWVVGWLAAVLGLSLWSFSRREI